MTVLPKETKTAKIIGLTPDKQQLIRNLAKEIRKTGYAELDENRVREDLYGLYGDIMQELKEKHNDRIEDLYELSEVLNEIAMLSTPETAYISGWKSREEGIDPEKGYMAFLWDIDTVLESSGLTKKRNNLFHGLCEALSDARSLITEYIELQSKVSIEQFRIHRFFELGYSDIGIPFIYEQETKA